MSKKCFIEIVGKVKESICVPIPYLYSSNVLWLHDNLSWKPGIQIVDLIMRYNDYYL